MSVRKLSRMLFLVNALQFTLGTVILFALWGDALEYREEILDLAVFLDKISAQEL